MLKTDFYPNVLLTPHFHLNEFLYSKYIDDTNNVDLLQRQCSIDTAIINNLQSLCQCVLEPARIWLDAPIKINSGYRCDKLNLFVGGVHHSQHLFGEAADITCDNNRELFEYIKDNLDFDQLICYGDSEHPRFLHVSYDCAMFNRKEVLYK